MLAPMGALNQVDQALLVPVGLPLSLAESQAEVDHSPRYYAMVLASFQSTSRLHLLSQKSIDISS